MKVTLLGTGTPQPSLRRMASATVVETPIGSWLIDCGDAAIWQMLRAGIMPEMIRYLVFTHLHTDHTFGYGAFVAGGYYRGRRTLRVWGPERVLSLHRMLADFYRDDGGSDHGLDIVQVSAYREGVLFDSAELQVDALEVNHSQETYALRFRAEGQTIVHSADTSYREPLIEFARGADILIHNAPAVEAARVRMGNRWDIIHEIMATPAEAGRVARLAGVKKLVLVHLSPDADPQIVQKECATEFAGNIIVGEDLQMVECER